MTSALRRALEPVARPVRRLVEPAARAVAGMLDKGRGRPDVPEGAGAVDPAAWAYVGEGGADGVLLCHGFTSTPQSMRPWAEHLEEAGFAVSVPRLPGHGTSWHELNKTSWTDWYAELDAAYVELAERCERVFLAGLSMGGCLVLRLAQQRGSAISGLVLVNPVLNITDPRMRALPALQLVVPSLGAIANDIARPDRTELAYDRNPLRALYSQTKLWADVRANLDRIDQPLLVYRSEQDHVVDASSVPLISAGVRSTDATFVTLARSYHVATLDYEAEQIFDGSVDFFRRLADRTSKMG